MKITFKSDVTLVCFLDQAASVLAKSFKKGDELELVSFFITPKYFKESLIVWDTDNGAYWAAWVFNSCLFTPAEFDIHLNLKGIHS